MLQTIYQQIKMAKKKLTIDSASELTKVKEEQNKVQRKIKIGVEKEEKEQNNIGK